MFCPVGHFSRVLPSKIFGRILVVFMFMFRPEDGRELLGRNMVELGVSTGAIRHSIHLPLLDNCKLSGSGN